MGAHTNLGNLSDAQEITADDTASTNTIDLATTRQQIGVGVPIYLCIRTNTAPTDTADTLSIELQMDSAVGFSSPTVVFMPLVGANGVEIAGTDARLLTAGAWIFRGSIPYECSERHIRLMYRNTTSNGTFTIDAWLDLLPWSDFGANAQVWVSPVGNP
jgi:hypothetical protein